MKKLDEILNKVEKPARYIGMELGSVEKDFEAMDVSMAFSYPDVYEIGMSYSGLEIIYGLVNKEDNFICERVFAPWPDMEGLMRDQELPLFSLESKKEIREFDFFAFTFQYELSYTNILNMLDLAGLELFARDRGLADPIIIGGGPCSYNPEPMADFFDIFLIGEGEESILETLQLYKEVKDQGLGKEDFLARAGREIEGAYVPEFYEEVYQGQDLVGRRALEDVPKVVAKRYIRDFDSAYFNPQPLVANIKSVHDRIVEGIFRGCTQGCRFCQAGMIYRPIREKSPQTIMDHLDKKLEATGHNELSLSSLSTCDYSRLEELLQLILDKYREDNISISLPSLRLDSKGLRVLEMIDSGRKPSITFAPEAGSQRLRNVINKNISEEDIMKAIDYSFAKGYSSIKLYFMIGLPTENYQDLDELADLVYKIKDAFYAQDIEDMQGNLAIGVSSSNFVPKAFTPFQWLGQEDIGELDARASYLKERLLDNKITYSYHDSQASRIEAGLARGDRRVSRAIYLAWKKGASFDAWQEYFDYDRWLEAFSEAGLSLDYYANGARSYDQALPWDFIDIGVSKDFLIREAEKAKAGKTTQDCRGLCYSCGINENYPGDYCP